MPEIKDFFIVCRPTKISELADICFQTNARELLRLGKGGLEPSDIHGIYDDFHQAQDIARDLLGLKPEPEDDDD